MKTLKYTNANKAIDVEYLVDLIGANKMLTIFQVTQFVAGVEQVNLNAAAQTFGMLDKCQMYSLADMTTQATAKNLTLNVYESGQNVVNLNTLTALDITNTSFTAGVAGHNRKETITVPATTGVAQGDYLIIKNALSQKTAAIWLDVDAAGVAPTGAAYVAADYKAKASVATLGNTATNAAAFLTALNTLTDFVVELTMTDNGDGTLSLVQKYCGVVTASTPHNTGDTGVGSITVASVQVGTVGTAYSLQLAATGGNAPYVWSTASTLPTGLALSATGLLSGTPRKVATTSLVVLLTDQFGVTDTLTANVVVTEV
jgi:hypothetical protein